ncbi:hypothetical protein K431DRAFT_344056 [Polychaeton citri CBS 116435]|uniref:Uncharacterized protein n=1 Tax=Polychaeton citri CBS 116435 TaxID=1314669 RepID=A0A9P4QED1_9PEZI|nr:hypothetical protein K431DRAFT_344056 [Polychaeton citri CBS 116435]
MSLGREAQLYTAKFGLRLASIVFAIIAAAMLGSAVPLQLHFSTDGLGGAVDGIAICAPSFALFWSSTSIVLLACLRRKRKSYHPAVDITMDFLTSGLAISLGSLVLWWNVYMGGAHGYDSQWSGYRSNGDRRGQGARVSGFEAAGASFCILLAAVHLPLFMIGCYETDVWRKTKKHGKRGVEVSKYDGNAVEVELQHQQPVRK